jgi:hypothetical protein
MLLLLKPAHYCHLRVNATFLNVCLMTMLNAVTVLRGWWMDGWVWSNGGIILAVVKGIPDKRQYLISIVLATNSDMLWPGTEPNPSSDCSPQPQHESSFRRIATSCKHVTFGSVGHFKSATSNLPIQSVGWLWNPSFSGSRIQSDTRPDTIQGTSQAM